MGSDVLLSARYLFRTTGGGAFAASFHRGAECTSAGLHYACLFNSYPALLKSREERSDSGAQSSACNPSWLFEDLPIHEDSAGLGD